MLLQTPDFQIALPVAMLHAASETSKAWCHLKRLSLGLLGCFSQLDNSACRHKSQDADRSAPQKRLRADDGVEDAPEVKPIHQDSSHAKDGASKGDRPKHGSERHDRKRGAEPEKGIVPDKEVESQRARSRDDRRTREENHPRSSKER